MQFYGHYRSSTTQQTGCVREFFTTAHARMDFPPQVMRTCSLCKKEHAFRFIFGHVASTPGQRKNLAAYAQTHGIESDVAL